MYLHVYSHKEYEARTSFCVENIFLGGEQLSTNKTTFYITDTSWQGRTSFYEGREHLSMQEIIFPWGRISFYESKTSFYERSFFVWKGTPLKMENIFLWGTNTLSFNQGNYLSMKQNILLSKRTSFFYEERTPFSSSKLSFNEIIHFTMKENIFLWGTNTLSFNQANYLSMK